MQYNMVPGIGIPVFATMDQNLNSDFYSTYFVLDIELSYGESDFYPIWAKTTQVKVIEDSNFSPLCLGRLNVLASSYQSRFKNLCLIIQDPFYIIRISETSQVAYSANQFTGRKHFWKHGILKRLWINLYKFVSSILRFAILIKLLIII